jgi:RNA polymerase sigma factor for flagellar operon FliA
VAQIACNFQSNSSTAPYSSASEEIVRRHRPLVIHIARSIACRFPSGIDIVDLIADGNIGLVQAIARFVPEHGISFSAFARHRIRGSILDGLRASLPVPREFHARRRSMEDAISRIANRTQQYPTNKEIAGEMGLSEEVLHEMRRSLRAAGCFLSIDQSQAWVPEPDRLPARTRNPESLAMRNETSRNLDHALRGLPPRYQTVIKLYYSSGRAMKEIGAILGVNESRVSQIHHRALALLRTQLATRRAEFLF